MRKNGFVVMGHLLKLVTPLAHIMAFTITMGTLGFLAAIFIMVLGAMGLVNLLNFETHLSFSGILTALIVLAVARGALRYLEQMSGHYIAFKLLALLRDKVFSSLRRLAFVKLQDKQAGQLVSLVTNDTNCPACLFCNFTKAKRRKEENTLSRNNANNLKAI